jgi:hypothetical protein
LWASLGSLVTFILVLLASGTEYPFSSIATESSIELVFRRVYFPSLPLFLIAPIDIVQLCS